MPISAFWWVPVVVVRESTISPSEATMVEAGVQVWEGGQEGADVLAHRGTTDGATGIAVVDAGLGEHRAEVVEIVSVERVVQTLEDRAWVGRRHDGASLLPLGDSVVRI